MAKYLFLSNSNTSLCKECLFVPIKKDASYFCSKTCSNRFNSRRPEVKIKVGNPDLKLNKDHPKRQKYYQNLTHRYEKKHPFYSGGEKGWFTSERVKGENNVNWNNGISKINKTERQLAMARKDYEFWRKSIFNRDNYTCQKCHIKGGKLRAHHLKSWKSYPQLRYAFSNGLTVCHQCHIIIHKEAARRNKGGVVLYA